MTLCERTDPLVRCGDGTLAVEYIAGQSAVTTCTSRSPLKILVPRPRASSVWAYLSSFGGGLVAGDQTRLRLSVGENARCFVTTQASTKVYRNSQQTPCSHETVAHVGARGLLVFAPDPIQCFAGSTYTQRQMFHVDNGGSLVLLDWLSCGRGARGERWAFTRYASRNEVFVGGRDPELILLDSTKLDSADGAIDSPARMGRFNCIAVLALLGPSLANHAQAILEEVNNAPVVRGAAVISSANPLRDGVLLRIAGPGVEEVGRVLAGHLAFLGHELGDDPWSRKW